MLEPKPHNKLQAILGKFEFEKLLTFYETLTVLAPVFSRKISEITR